MTRTKTEDMTAGRQRSHCSATVAALAILLSAVALPVGTFAQTVPPDAVSASLQLARETVYEHECFDMVLSIEIRGAQVGRNIELAGMPDTRLLQFGQFQERPIQRQVRNARQIEVRSYKTAVRAVATGSVQVSPSLRLGIVSTQTGPFGSMRFESPVVANVAPRTIKIAPLPPAPAQGTFSGAVGQFQFSAVASPTNLAPGDLVRIVSRIVGNGWTENVLPPRLSPGGAFRVYEPKPVPLAQGETPELQFEQTLVPQTTNATEIPVLSFTFFDPSAGIYRTASAGPFRLHFQSRRAPAHEDPAPTSAGTPGAAGERRAPRSLLEGVQPSTQWTILAVSIMYWLAVATAMAGLAARLRRGVLGALVLLVAALLVFAGAAAVARQRFLVRPAGVAVRQEDARVAPAPAALVSFNVPKDASVSRIEELGDWVKVETGGNRGWIPASALSEKR